MELVLKGEPKEIADFVQAIQNPPMLKIKEPDASTVTKDFLKAIDDMLQARRS